MDTSPDIRQMILKDASADQLRDAARKNGMRTLAEDGWRLVRNGTTTAEEVLRVTKDQSLGGGIEKAAATPTAA
jgi:type II secretory ATPase GspE/PulE/Tfp pilus assembly ATPase PilB-like protein